MTAPSTSEVAKQGAAPERAGLVLIALILVAAVANLNLAVANVALPDIGKAFSSSQTALDLIAVGYSLGLEWVGRLGAECSSDVSRRDACRRECRSCR